jgi:hypothetical protein
MAAQLSRRQFVQRSVLVGAGVLALSPRAWAGSPRVSHAWAA